MKVTQYEKENIKSVDDYFAGVLVENVTPNSPAAYAGIKTDDVIISAANRNVRTALDLKYEVYSWPVGKRIPILVRRNSKVLKLVLKVQAAN